MTRGGFEGAQRIQRRQAAAFKPKLRWITETRGKVYVEPIFVPESSLSAPRLWIAEDAGHVGASLDPDYWPVVLGFLQENGL